MRSDDRFTTLAVITVLLATATLFVVLNGRLPTSDPPASFEVVYEPVTAVEPPMQHAVAGRQEGGKDLSLVALREDVPTPIPPRAGARELPALVAAAEAVLSARAPSPALPTRDEVLVRADRDGRLVVAAGTMRRYRPLVAELEAFDPEAVVTAAQNGHAGSVLAALDRLLAVGLPEVEPTMVERGVRWGFADPAYEGLDDAQRHLLLMGRAQHRRVRAKLFELRAALGTFPVVSEPAFVTASSQPPDPVVAPPPADPASEPVASEGPVPVEP